MGGVRGGVVRGGGVREVRREVGGGGVKGGRGPGGMRGQRERVGG